jgi:hypothetical protein
MGSAGLVEKPGDKHFVVGEVVSANRAHTGALSAQTMGASVNVHEPVSLAHGGVCGGFYPLAMDKPD